MLDENGDKRYLPATKADIRSYEECSKQLQREIKSGSIRLPETTLADGFNTRQAIGYNYTAWRDFFNDRQLLALGWLQEAIINLPEQSVRDAFLLLFSGVLEFNNLFASYKGEGTGAVRHMFAHHILKPERMPIEANVWGTSKSSGSFSTLFKTRLLRAASYRHAPTEVSLREETRGTVCSRPFSGAVERNWPTTEDLGKRAIYLSCGSSDNTGLPDKSVNLVVTDPPFFDNVHYSELADFFFAWQNLAPRGFIEKRSTTRHGREVQDTDADLFSEKLAAVFGECCRVLRDDGLLVFTYHHSRSEGWSSVLRSLIEAGFSVVNAHPVKSEMSVATPKAQAKEPIQLDVILICKKRDRDARPISKPSKAMAEAIGRATLKLSRLTAAGLQLSLNDKRIIFISQFIAALGPVFSTEAALDSLRSEEASLDEAALTVSSSLERRIGQVEEKAITQQPFHWQ